MRRFRRKRKLIKYYAKSISYHETSTFRMGNSRRKQLLGNLFRLKVLNLFEFKKWIYIPLTNRVWGPYCKLRDRVFFLLYLMAQARSARAINRRGKNEDPYLTVRTEENEVSKIVIISLVCVWGAQTRVQCCYPYQLPSSVAKEPSYLYWSLLDLPFSLCGCGCNILNFTATYSVSLRSNLF